MNGRVSDQGTFSEIYIKMTKYLPEEEMYEPFEIKLRYPEIPDPKAGWKDVWADSFKEEVKTLTKEESPENQLDSAIQVLRLMEVIGSSLEQDGKRIDNINLVAQENMHDWVTLGSDAGIN